MTLIIFTKLFVNLSPKSQNGCPGVIPTIPLKRVGHGLSRGHRFYPPPISRSSPALPSATPLFNMPPEKAIPNPDNPSTLRAQDTDALIKFLLLSLDQPPAV